MDDSPGLPFARSFSLASSNLLAVPILVRSKESQNLRVIGQGFVQNTPCLELVWHVDGRLSLQLQLIQWIDLGKLLCPRWTRDVWSRRFAFKDEVACMGRYRQLRKEEPGVPLRPPVPKHFWQTVADDALGLFPDRL